MPTLIRTILVLLLVTLQLASTGLSSSGVLCVGNDGHVAVELAHDACSKPSATPACCCMAADACPSTVAVSGSDCDDLPLPDSNTQAATRELKVALDSHPAMAPPLATGRLLPELLPRLIVGQTITGDSYLTDEPVHRTLHHQAHRSVTLLI